MLLQTLSLTACLVAGLSSATLTTQLNGTSFYSPDVVETWIESVEPLVKRFMQFTLFNFGDKEVTADELTSEPSRFLSTDDVFAASFLSTIVLRSGTSLCADAQKLVWDQWNATVLDSAIGCCDSLHPGPYFIHPDNSVTKAYRLYADPAMAFVVSVTPEQNNSFVPITGAIQGGINRGVSVAVPSRLYYPPPTAERPLEGKRLAVKDIYDLKGITTALQKLLDLGAVVVGKSKTTFFALGEYPTADYVDQLAPFNPRGDGYQNPEGSSCGTGAGVASYDWLDDFGTGSDTGGSVRLPSMQNGLFGMRITNASLSLDGIVPITPQFDTPGLLTKDAALLRDAYQSWFQSKDYASYPKRIIMP